MNERVSDRKSLLDWNISLAIPPRSIFLCQIRACSSAVLAVVLIASLGPVLFTMVDAYMNTRPVEAGDLARIFWGALWLGGFLVALAVGSLCGAEDEERGTLDFTWRLPVAYPRILCEKILGGLAALLLYYLVGYLVDCAFMLLLSGQPLTLPVAQGKVPTPLWLRAAPFMTLLPGLFFSSLAAGAWARRVVVAAVIGGGYMLLVSACTRFYSVAAGLSDPRSGFLPTFLIFGIALPLALTIARYTTREGR